MPSSYLVAVAVGSALDSDSNNLTLFSLVEAVQVPPTFPATLDYEVHAYWEFAADERADPFEFRIVVSVEGSPSAQSEPRPLPPPTSGRFRIRVRGVVLLGAGEHRVACEVKRLGTDEWTRSAHTWPLRVSVAAAEPTGT